jgi:hypothetical protein
MALVADTPFRPWSLRSPLSVEVDAPAVGAWTSAFSIVAYLALRDGGYDTVVRSQVGIAVWWIVLLSALAGVLPGRIGVAGWTAIGLFGAFAAWTTVAVGWSENVESTVVEVGRLSAYLGVLVLAISLQGRTAMRHTINGLACAIGLITILAVLSRLHPAWFPPNHAFQFLGSGGARKLSYPLNYWNGLAAFTAMGVPLLVAVAVGARTIAGRALSAATLPVAALCLYLTVSRGGVLELGVGLVVFLIATPRRLDALGTLVVSGAGAGILVWATSKRGVVAAGLPTAAETHQGTRLLLLGVVVCAGVALLQVAIALAASHVERPAWLAPGRRATAWRGLGLAIAIVAVAVAAGAPGKIDHAWHDFKQPIGVITPGTENSLFSRLSAVNGNARYQLWQAAFHAAESRPWLGIGPGTFRFWWAEHPTSSVYVLNAHSLYFETLAETGIIGFTLLGGFLLWGLAVAVRRLFRGPPDQRLWIAAALAGFSVFLAAATLEWVWQLAAVAAAALILVAAIVSGGEERSDARAPGTTGLGAQRAARATLAVLAIASIGAILLPLSETVAVTNSRIAAGSGHLAAAYQDSLAAQQLEPYAETPRLQQALVLEAAGDLGPAAAAARAATERGPTDSGAWLTLARIDARRGATTAALAELRRARQLDPEATLFQQP